MITVLLAQVVHAKRKPTVLLPAIALRIVFPTVILATRPGKWFLLQKTASNVIQSTKTVVAQESQKHVVIVLLKLR